MRKSCVVNIENQYVPDSWSLLVKDILEFHGEDLPELVELLRAHLGHRVARLQRQLLERLLVARRVEQLHHGAVALVRQPHEHFLPKSSKNKVG